MTERLLPEDVGYVTKKAHVKAELHPEIRATFLPEHGVFTVPSLSRPGASYQVTAEARPDGIVWLSCSCRAGEYRTDYPVCCVHAAIAGRLLAEMLHTIIYRGLTGLWYARPKEPKA
jgi:hypothetical protein